MGEVHRKAGGTASSHSFESPASWYLNVFHMHCASTCLGFLFYGDGLA